MGRAHTGLQERVKPDDALAVDVFRGLPVGQVEHRAVADAPVASGELAGGVWRRVRRHSHADVVGELELRLRAPGPPVEHCAHGDAHGTGAGDRVGLEAVLLDAPAVHRVHAALEILCVLRQPVAERMLSQLVCVCEPKHPVRLIVRHYNHQNKRHENE